MQLPGLEEWCTGRIPSTHAPCPANILHSCTGRCHFKDLPREGGRSFLYLLCPPTPCPDPGLAGSSFASSDLLSAHSPRPMTPTAVRRTEFVPQAIPPSSRSGDQSPLPWASQVELVAKKLPANAGDIRDADSIPESGRSPGGGYGNPLQYSCLENPMDRGTWWAIVHGVTKSQTPLSN